MKKNAALAKIHAAAVDTVVLAFKDMGFGVESIPTSDEHRTADLLVTKGEERHTVEVTTKNDSGAFDAALKAGETAEADRIEQHSSTMKNVLRGKKQQVRATGTGGFGVLWVEAIGTFGADIVDEIVATFLGRVLVAASSVGGQRVQKPCYFYDKAECFEHPDLNAVVAAHGGGARLLVNPKAYRVDEFRQSALVAEFAPGVVVDPMRDVANGTAFTLEDYRGLRAPTAQNDRPRRAFLAEKHGFDLVLPLRMHKMTVAKVIGFDELAQRLDATNAAALKAADGEVQR